MTGFLQKIIPWQLAKSKDSWIEDPTVNSKVYQWLKENEEKANEEIRKWIQGLEKSQPHEWEIQARNQNFVENKW